MIYKSPIKIDNAEDIRSKLLKNTGVIVFGTGNVGLIALNFLKKQNINVICLSDNNSSRWNEVIDGCRIVPPEELKSTENKTPIIIANNLNFTFIRRQLKDLGLTNIYDCDFIFSNVNIDVKECNLTWTETNLKKEIDLYMYSLSAWKEKKNFIILKNVHFISF